MNDMIALRSYLADFNPSFRFLYSLMGKNPEPVSDRTALRLLLNPVFVHSIRMIVQDDPEALQQFQTLVLRYLHDDSITATDTPGILNWADGSGRIALFDGRIQVYRTPQQTQLRRQQEQLEQRQQDLVKEKERCLQDADYRYGEGVEKIGRWLRRQSLARTAARRLQKIQNELFAVSVQMQQIQEQLDDRLPDSAEVQRLAQLTGFEAEWTDRP